MKTGSFQEFRAVDPSVKLISTQFAKYFFLKWAALMLVRASERADTLGSSGSYRSLKITEACRQRRKSSICSSGYFVS